MTKKETAILNKLSREIDELVSLYYVSSDDYKIRVKCIFELMEGLKHDKKTTV